MNTSTLYNELGELVIRIANNDGVVTFKSLDGTDYGGSLNNLDTCCFTEFCPPIPTISNQPLCGAQVVNLNSLEPIGFQGGVWTLNGTAVTNTLSVNTIGTYIYTFSNGSCTYSNNMVIYRNDPDYTPNITLIPDSITGNQIVSGLVEISELNGNPSCSLIYILLPSLGQRYILNYEANGTDLLGNQISNSKFEYLGIFNSNHIWVYVGNGTQASPDPFPSNGSVSFGFSGMYDNQGSEGQTTFTIQVFQGSGGETRIDNNFDGATLTYFA